MTHNNALIDPTHDAVTAWMQVERPNESDAKVLALACYLDAMNATPRMPMMIGSRVTVNGYLFVRTAAMIPSRVGTHKVWYCGTLTTTYTDAEMMSFFLRGAATVETRVPEFADRSASQRLDGSAVAAWRVFMVYANNRTEEDDALIAYFDSLDPVPVGAFLAHPGSTVRVTAGPVTGLVVSVGGGRLVLAGGELLDFFKRNETLSMLYMGNGVDFIITPAVDHD